jgi:hypothetical protein
MRRKFEHVYGSKHTTRTYHFHNAIRKYGIDAFTFDVIDCASSLEELNLLEEKYAKQYDCYTNGYNLRQAGNNKLHSEASKERMQAAQRAAHARRRAEGRDTFTKTVKTSGWKWTDSQKEKLKTHADKLSKQLSNKTWKVIDGKRVWLDKGATV